MIWMILIKNIKEYDPNKECKILIIFDDMVADILSNKKLHAIETELFVGGTKLTFPLVSLHSLTVPRNTNKEISDQGTKQIKALKVLKSDTQQLSIKNEFQKIN